jgi:hypothetical protein
MNLTFPSQYNFVLRYFRLALANVLSNIMVALANLISIIFLGHLEEIQHFAGVALAVKLLNFLCQQVMEDKGVQIKNVQQSLIHICDLNHNLTKVSL